MMLITGFLVVLVSVAGGYLMADGNIHILFQPAEFIIIVGAAIGGFIIATPVKIMKSVMRGMRDAFVGKFYTKKAYMELLTLLYEVLFLIRKDGLLAIEKHINHPEKSEIFRHYPLVYKNDLAFTFIIDILRNIISTTLSSHELESLLDNELESIYEESMHSSSSVSEIAESLPGLGIVAAVLGVVITMQNIAEPPEVLGHMIGAAMVGTFLGILLCYGFVGPVGKKLEYLAADHRDFLDVIRVAFVSFVGGAHYLIAVEFGRRVSPPNVKPTFDEVEDAINIKKRKWRERKR